MAVHPKAFAFFLFSPKGRITRGQWWLFQVFAFFVFVLGLFLTPLPETQPDPGEFAWGVVAFCLEISMIWIALSAAAKRFHDRGKSGWNALWQLLPLIGSIYVLYACGITDNGRKINKYGPPVASLEE